MAKNVIIGQSGGPTAVINQSLVGCVEALRAAKHDGRILGAKHAVRGIINDDFIDLTDIPQDKLDRVAQTPSSALRSSRDKPDEAYCKKILASFEKHDVGYFFYIGGNDSSDTCRVVNDLAKSSGYDVSAFHIPKTIDNDLMENDHTPGFPSAARFVACAFMGDNLDNRSLPGIKINIVMGRHAGFLTAAAALARKFSGDGPHLIYVPETAFDIDAFVKDVERVFEKYGRCVIAASEGIHTADGTPIVSKLASKIEKDAHGNVQLSGTGALGDFLATEIKAKLGQNLRVRADTFGYLQRSFPGIASPIDQTEARQAGRAAAERALSGEKQGSIAIRRTSDDPYTVSFDQIKLTDVAAKTRVMPDEFRAGTNDVTEAFMRYVTPLVGELPVIEHL